MTLTEILRVSVVSGGNIEFVFNNLDQYINGINNSAFYDTDIQVASSVNWQLHFGAESDLIGSDDPTKSINKNNIGFTIAWTGVNSCCGAGDQVSSITGIYDDATTGTANGLATYTGGGADLLLTFDTGTNGGDVNDNKFTIHWECGTQGGGNTPMNASSLLGKRPDRYVTTVILELEAL